MICQAFGEGLAQRPDPLVTQYRLGTGLEYSVQDSPLLDAEFSQWALFGADGEDEKLVKSRDRLELDSKVALAISIVGRDRLLSLPQWFGVPRRLIQLVPRPNTPVGSPDGFPKFQSPKQFVGGGVQLLQVSGNAFMHVDQRAAELFTQRPAAGKTHAAADDRTTRLGSVRQKDDVFLQVPAQPLQGQLVSIKALTAQCMLESDGRFENQIAPLCQQSVKRRQRMGGEVGWFRQVVVLPRRMQQPVTNRRFGFEMLIRPHHRRRRGQCRNAELVFKYGAFQRKMGEHEEIARLRTASGPGQTLLGELIANSVEVRYKVQ